MKVLHQVWLKMKAAEEVVGVGEHHRGPLRRDAFGSGFCLSFVWLASEKFTFPISERFFFPRQLLRNSTGNPADSTVAAGARGTAAAASRHLPDLMVR